MSTVPVFACNRCGRPVRVTHLSTQHADENGEQLQEFMRNLRKIAYCNSCRRKRDYYAQQGRIEDFYAGRP